MKRQRLFLIWNTTSVLKRRRMAAAELPVLSVSLGMNIIKLGSFSSWICLVLHFLPPRQHGFPSSIGILSAS